MPAVADLTLDLVRAAAREVAEAHNLDLVVLFGSAARDGFAEAGDVDLGVRGTPIETSGSWDALFTLGGVFARRLDVGPVDVVDLGRGSEILHAHVARDGVPVYEREPGAFDAFRRGAERRFEEMRPQHEAEWEETRRVIRSLLPPTPDYRPWGSDG